MSNELMKRPVNEVTLTDKQSAFIEAYVGEARFNATRAAEIAGYSKCAESGWDCMQVPAIKHAIKVRCDATAMHADELLMLLGHEARGVGDYVEVIKEEVWEGNAEQGRWVTRETAYVDVKRMKKDGKRSLLKKVSRNEYGPVYEFVDPLAAKTLLAKVLALVPETPVDPTTKAAELQLLATALEMGYLAGKSSLTPVGHVSVTGSSNVSQPVAGSDGVIEAVYKEGEQGEKLDTHSVGGVDGTSRGVLSVGGRSAPDALTLHAQTPAAMAGTIAPFAYPAVVVTGLGVCMICGEEPASKTTRGGAKVCSVCIPG